MLSRRLMYYQTTHQQAGHTAMPASTVQGRLVCLDIRRATRSPPILPTPSTHANSTHSTHACKRYTHHAPTRWVPWPCCLATSSALAKTFDFHAASPPTSRMYGLNPCTPAQRPSSRRAKKVAPPTLRECIANSSGGNPANATIRRRQFSTSVSVRAAGCF